MTLSYFCPRCGQGDRIARDGVAACDRCGCSFATPTAKAPTPAGVRAYDVWTSILLYLFMPVGLIMLWSHPTWSTARKWTLTGVAVSVIVVPIVLATVMLIIVSLTGTRH